MISKAETQSTPRFVSGLAAAGLLLAAACSTSVNDPPGMGGPSGNTGSGAGAGGPATGGSSGATVGNGGSAGTVGPDGCEGTEVVASKRLIRLTFNQIANSLRVLLGATLADQVSQTFQIGDPTSRTFPPLANPREGSVVTDAVWQSIDGIGQAAGKYVLDNFAAVTSCGAAPTDACGQQFLTTFAQRAYRHPLSDAERMNLLTVFSEVKTAGGSVNEAVQFGVYAVLQAPQFLYRTEFGAASAEPGPLSPYETASAVSYFLTDGPPDQPLLDAAQQGQLATPEQIGGQVTRLLATPEARTNLQSALFAYFSLPTIATVVIDVQKVPAFTPGVRNSMYHEAELFLNNTLWSGKTTDLLTSRRSTINAGLAGIYGMSFPPAGATLDADGFATVDLPENRSGLLTQAGFLTARARPDNQSVVGRGLLVNAAIMCAENPPFPDNLAEQIAIVNMMQEDQTERQKSDYRSKTAPCVACHPSFDPYGLALESYDVIGRFRTLDDLMRPIDSSVTLPPNAGSSVVKDAVEMSSALASGGGFETCLAKNLIAYAMAEGADVDVNSCSTRAVNTAYKASDRTFSSLIREVVVSKAFTVRNPGGI